MIGPDAVRIEHPKWFRSLTGDECIAFLETTFLVRDVREVEIDADAGAATIFHRGAAGPAPVLRALAAVYRLAPPEAHRPRVARGVVARLPRKDVRVRFFRTGRVVSIWEPREEGPGILRIRNSWVMRQRYLHPLFDRELMRLIGIESFKVHRRAGSIRVVFNPLAIHAQQIVATLDRALEGAPRKAPKTKLSFDLPVSSGSLALAATATFAMPALVPVSAVVMLGTAVPSFRRAYAVVRRERRLGVDVLDSIIFSACLFTGQIFAGAMTAWFLSVGRTLLRSTKAQSTQLLLDAFGRQPSLVRVLRDGEPIEVSLREVKRGETVIIHTGEVVPVDGEILLGDAILDEHALTGESSPAEKEPKDRVLASTLLVAGSIHVRVDRAGSETTSNKIAAILQKTVAYRLDSQSRGEQMADRAVIPALGLASFAGVTLGVSGGLAVINSDLGTGIRMAAPLGLLTSLTACAQNGILVKEGRALETVRRVDTVLFDKTGTLTRAAPEVGAVLCCGPWNEAAVLRFAAAAEQHFTHPIARAILDRYAKFGQALPQIDDSKYQVGFGIVVEIEGRKVEVGSRRFMVKEGIAIPPEIDRRLQPFQHEGSSFVNVAVDGELAGVLELRASPRPEALGIVAGLRARGIKHMAIISGDHDAPTRRLAETLGMDRHFAEVLPEDKARYVKLLQDEGRTVCFVGDGINDAVALRQADVSISMRGASSIATDTAQVVFMEENIAKLCTLFDLSRNLEQNVQRSWHMILGPNVFCIAGVFLLGFNIWHSVFFNNVSALLALANGMLPLRRIAQAAGPRDRLAHARLLEAVPPPDGLTQVVTPAGLVV